MTTTELAELIKDELNDTTFSQAFTAIRVAMPLFKLSDMGTLHVTVVPRELAVSLGSRRDNSYEMGVDVAVQQRLANVNNATVDALVTLAQARHVVHDLLGERGPHDAPENVHGPLAGDGH